MTDAANSLEQPQATQDSATPASVDHRKYRGTPRKNSRTKSEYTEEQKTFALAVYAETGSVRSAAEQAGIPHTTLDYWLKQDPDIDAKLERIRSAIRERAAFLFAEIAVNGARELLDRVQNGDYHTDKEGNITRRPMPGRELAFVVATMTDKHALVTGTMTRVNAEDQQLSSLADKLVKAIEQRRKPKPQTYPQAEAAPDA